LESTERIQIEKFLSNNEQVLWTGRPEKESFRIKNIRQALFDFVKQVLVVFLFLWVYDLIFHREFFMEADLLLFVWSVPVFFTVNAITVIIKISRVDKVLYCVTDRRVLVFTDIDKHKLMSVDKLQIRKKEKVSTAIEKAHNVHTIKLMTADPDLDFQLENIDNNFEL
jgi:hypothetical protein